MQLHIAAAVMGAVAVFCCTANGAAPAPAERPLPRTHAHNDYLHPHPLLDALHHGFVGVEADVFLVGTELRVAHDRQADWSKVPTLEAAYLTPLAERVKRRGGSVYGDGTTVMLLIDLKSEPVSTYRRVHDVLGAYQAANPGLFTTYTRGGDGQVTVSRGAVNVVISGVTRPKDVMAAQEVRYAGCDGRLGDIGPDVKPEDRPQLVPLISDNWNNALRGEAKWDGKGDPPAATRARLKELADTVHVEGKQFRLWNLPVDGPAVWGLLYDAGVDLINTDDLEGLAKFVTAKAEVRTTKSGADPKGEEGN